MTIDRKQRIEQLEGQIRYELERRFSDLAAQCRQRALELLSPAEQAIFSTALTGLLEHPSSALNADAQQVFDKLDTDAQTRELFRRLQQVVQLRGRALESGVAPVAPSGTPSAEGDALMAALMAGRQAKAAASPDSQPAVAPPAASARVPMAMPAPQPMNPQQLQSAIKRLTADLQRVDPNIDHWPGWWVRLLEAMELQAASDPDSFEQALNRLQDLIGNRLSNHRW